MSHILSADPGVPSFRFEEQLIRVIIGSDGEPHFVAADVCKVLEINNVSMALSRLDDIEKGISSIDTIARGRQQMATVNESGLYSLILTSRKPEAKRFKRWVTAEVLPTIRKTGSYSVTPLTPAEALLQAVQQIVDHENRMKQLETDQRQQQDRVTRLEARVQTSEDGIGYFSVLAFYRYRNLPSPDLATAQTLGKRASRLSRKLGYSIGKTRDPRFGEVSTYHESILEQIIETKGGDVPAK